MNFDYPELYYKIYPKIIDAINDNLESDISIESITEEKIDTMVKDIYMKLIKECPEIHQDPVERRYRGRGIGVEQIPFYGRSRIIRDIITVFLISELLRRNRYGGYWNYSNPYFYPL